MPVRSALAALVLLAVAGGCASAEDAYVDGMNHETAGDYAAAADAYITALERDPEIRNVTGRLMVAGREAVRVYLARAEQLGPRGDVETVAESYLGADALVARARGVGVTIARPATFEADRDAAFATAVGVFTDDAERLRAEGDYEGAIARVDQALRYRPSAERRARLDAVVVEVRGDWAADELAAGRYRAALAQADAALAAAGDGPRAGALAALRAEVVGAGSLLAAVLPAEGPDDADDAFLRELTDVIAEDRLAEPVPFLYYVDPADVRRWDRRRRQRGPRFAESPRRIAEAADDLGADFGVALYVYEVETAERVGEPSAETVQTDAGERATYTRREVTLELSTSADLVVVEAVTGQTACDETVRQRAEAAYGRPSYDGDWRDLRLGRTERGEFSGDAEGRARDRALDALRESLADALADRVTACLGRQVP